MPTGWPPCGSGPATPVRPNAPGRGAALSGADGHGPRCGGGDGPDRIEQLRRHAGQRDLGVLDVGDQAAAQHHAGAGHPGKGGGQQARRQRLGGRDTLPAHRQVGDECAGVLSDQRVVHANP